MGSQNTNVQLLLLNALFTHPSVKLGAALCIFVDKLGRLQMHLRLSLQQIKLATFGAVGPGYECVRRLIEIQAICKFMPM